MRKKTRSLVLSRPDLYVCISAPRLAHGTDTTEQVQEYIRYVDGRMLIFFFYTHPLLICPGVAPKTTKVLVLHIKKS